MPCIGEDLKDYIPPTWDVLFMRLVYEVASKSKDKKTKIGAYIVGPDHEPISFGYNGMPRKVNDDLPDRHERPKKYLYAEHGERNAIYSIVRTGGSIPKGSVMYTQGTPCADCGRAVIQSGISKVIVHTQFEEIFRYLYDNWTESCDSTAEMFAEAGIELVKLDKIIGSTGYINGKIIHV